MSFPIEAPVSLPQNDVDQTTEPDIVEASVVAQETKPRKARRVRARNKVSRPR